jgi:outer membrane protein assembly factor BamE (lipoprotein component of BamABCDE complex)
MPRTPSATRDAAQPRAQHPAKATRAPLRLLLAAGLMLSLAACVTNVRQHGYLPAQEELDEIVIGVDSRETVADLVGSPTTAGLLSGGDFYYVGDVVQTRGWQKPEIVAREIVAITFDEAGVVNNITRYGLEDGRVVPIVRRVTETADGDIGFIRQLFGNIGGIDTGAFFDQ